MNCLRKKFKKDPAWTDQTTNKEEESIRQINEPDSSDTGQSSDGDSDSDSDLDAYVGDIRSKSLTLENKNVFYKKLTNINASTSSNKKSVFQVKLNNKYKLALVALYDGKVDLFEIDGERNKYLQNIKVPATRTPKAKFCPSGEDILFAGIDYKGSFYSYNMETSIVNSYRVQLGKESKGFNDFVINDNYMACVNNTSSELILLTAKSYEIVTTIKINEPANSVYLDSNNQLFVLGDNAHVYIWDIRQTNRCKHRFSDFGSVHCKSFAISEKSNCLSIGSDSGSINSYELNKCTLEKHPHPLQTFNNIKHPVDLLEYNSLGEILFAASTSHKNSCKLINSTSGIIYRNFPESGKTYGQIKDACFSPLDGYLAMGCSSGKAHLFRFPYYKSY